MVLVPRDLMPLVCAHWVAPVRHCPKSMRGRPVPLWVRGLPHFDQMTVGDRGCSNGSRTGGVSARQELSTRALQIGVQGLDVFDPDIEEAADPVAIAWRLEGDRRLGVGRASADIDDDPAVG